MPLLPVLAVMAAASLPSTTTPGVTAVRSSGGRLTIRFADTPAGRKAYQPLAGRRIPIRCQHVGDALFGAGPAGVVTTRVRMGRTLSSVTLRLRGNVNLCAFASPFGGITVAADPVARRFLADLSGLALLDVADRVGHTGAAATLKKLGRHVVRLRSSTATPPARRIGIYGDRGTTLGAVFASPSGHRLFAEEAGDVVRTNLLGVIDQVGGFPGKGGAPLPTGAQPPPGTPLPSTTDPEVTATRSGDQISIDFTGTARQGLAGAPVNVTCSLERPGIGVIIEHSVGASGFGPQPGQPLRVDIDHRFDLCAVSFRGRLVRVALDDAGRKALEEASVVAAIDRVLHNAAAGADAYPSAQTLSARYGGDVAALAAPADTPPDRRIGAWSDGARRLVLTAVARTGRRIFFEVDGRVVRSNIFRIPSLPGDD